MYEDQINLSSRVADGIGLALDEDFNRVELPERMAWTVLLLRKLPDNKEYFPRGKWATIQSIESQLDLAANQQFQPIKTADFRVICEGVEMVNLPMIKAYGLIYCKL